MCSCQPSLGKSWHTLDMSWTRVMSTSQQTLIATLNPKCNPKLTLYDIPKKCALSRTSKHRMCSCQPSLGKSWHTLDMSWTRVMSTSQQTLIATLNPKCNPKLNTVCIPKICALSRTSKHRMCSCQPSLGKSWHTLDMSWTRVMSTSQQTLIATLNPKCNPKLKLYVYTKNMCT